MTVLRSGTMKFQPRDLALLRGLFESRLMTAGHAAIMHFDGKAEAAKKRLQKLKAAGLIGERRRLVNESAILFLTRKGLLTLRDRGVLGEYPDMDLPVLDRRARVSDLTIRHELEVMDVKAAFHSAVGRVAALGLEEFTTWPVLHQFEAARPGQNAGDVLVKPDGFIRLHERERNGDLSEHTFFLEVDRSSESPGTLVARAGCYHHYYRSGGFAERNGADRSEFADYPFRVLMVFKTAERRNNVIEGLLRMTPPILTLAYLSTTKEATANPLGAVWMRPFDYREATKGTTFAPERRRGTWAYRRQTARELFIERNVPKRRLLAD